MTGGRGIKNLFAECRRRQIFKVAGLYIVGAWVALQVAALAFENWGIPTEAMRYVWIGAVSGFPIALILAWRFDIVHGRIVRTGSSEDDADRPLRRSDCLFLGTAATAAMTIMFATIAGISGMRPTIINDPNSIAVLPFADISPQSDQEYLSDGVAEELRNALGKMPDLRVISRTSAFAFKGQALEVPEIAKRLKVAYVLEGSVRKAGERIRITAQLIDARSDTQVWSGTYNRTVGDVLAIQDEIAASVVAALKSELLGDANPAPCGRAPRIDAQVYLLYLKGKDLLARREPGAAQFFERVIDSNAAFAPAYSGLARALFRVGDQEAAHAATERALSLDPGDAGGLVMMGLLLWDDDLESARAYFERAIECNPNDADAYRLLAHAYQESDPRRNLEYARKAYEREPALAANNRALAQALLRYGRFAEALALARDYHHLDPRLAPIAYGLAGDVWRTLGRMDMALKSEYLALRADPDGSAFADAGWVLVDLGEFPLAEAWARRWLPSGSWAAVTQLAVADFYQGRQQQALTMLAQAAERTGSPWLYTFLGHHLIEYEGDFAGARQQLERGPTQPGRDVVRIDPDLGMDWMGVTAYILALQNTGEPYRASEMLEELRSVLDGQFEAGTVAYRFWGLYFLSAIVHALDGDIQAGINDLERAVSTDLFLCAPCLRHWPQFDRLRGHPGFGALMDRVTADRAAQRQRLADAGLLLSPEAVLALDDFDFDPFADGHVTE